MTPDEAIKELYDIGARLGSVCYHINTVSKQLEGSLKELVTLEADINMVMVLMKEQGNTLKVADGTRD